MGRFLPIDPRTALTPPAPHRLMNPSRRTNRPGSIRASLLACTLAATADASPPAPFYARPPDAKLPGGVAP